jgi:3-oxoadipate enol-lactonase
MSFIRLAGQLLHYRLQGPVGAPVVVLANSLGTDARIWDEVIDRLAPRYHILSYDQRGHGLSDAPDGPYAFDDLVGDLDGLMIHLGIERAVLAGISLGGLVAQGFAFRHPERLGGLILLDTAAQIGDAAFWAARIEAVRAQGLAAMADGLLARWFTGDFRAREPDAYAGWRTMLERSSVAGYLGSCAALRDTDLREAIGGIVIRTLVLAGDSDVSTPPDLVRATAARLPRASFALIEGAGHLPNIERPPAVADAFERYFAEIDFA